MNLALKIQLYFDQECTSVIQLYFVIFSFITKVATIMNNDIEWVLSLGCHT